MGLEAKKGHELLFAGSFHSTSSSGTGNSTCSDISGTVLGCVCHLKGTAS